jgi:hypothetical protein
MRTNVRRVVRHLWGEVPEQIQLVLDDVLQMADRRRTCHQQEFAQWKSGRHGTTYARIFMDPKHNAKRRLMDDSLRCHGMRFAGGIADVVEPVSTIGPWQLKDQHRLVLRSLDLILHKFEALLVAPSHHHQEHYS